MSAWHKDLVTALVFGATAMLMVGIAGGPLWAVLGVFWIVYALWPKSNQEAERWKDLTAILREMNR